MPLILQIAYIMDNSFDVIKKPETDTLIPVPANIDVAQPSITEIVTKDRTEILKKISERLQDLNYRENRIHELRKNFGHNSFEDHSLRLIGTLHGVADLITLEKKMQELRESFDDNNLEDKLLRFVEKMHGVVF